MMAILHDRIEIAKAVNVSVVKLEQAVPKEPVIFLKATTSLCGPNDRHP
jgi:2-keto-4-pentenoate hydratase/2-oxohepta-3-ene-1,7-dioic acid hydratase in catechol pathway